MLLKYSNFPLFFYKKLGNLKTTTKFPIQLLHKIFEFVISCIFPNPKQNVPDS